MVGQKQSLPSVLVPLLKGVLYREDDIMLWSTLLQLRTDASSYMAVLGLELFVNETEGHAFLRSRVVETGEEESVPRLIARRPLPFYDSLLLALLRKKLAEFDATGTESRLVLKLDQILELIQLFLPERNDEVKLRERVEQSVKRLLDLGFVRKLKSTQDIPTYEVMRIIKDFVDAQWLSGLDESLQTYRTHGQDVKT